MASPYGPDDGGIELLSGWQRADGAGADDTDQGGGTLAAKLLEYCWNRLGSSWGQRHGRISPPGRLGAATRGRRAEHRPREGGKGQVTSDDG